MGVLVIAEHDNRVLRPATLNALTAGSLLGDVSVLIAGEGCSGVAEEAAALQGVKRVLLCDDAVYAEALAEPLAELIAGIGTQYSHLLAPATTFGKNLMRGESVFI